MRRWYAFGAFGDCVAELSFIEWLGLLFGKEIAFNSTVICLGKSKRKSLGAAASREVQLKI